MSILVPQKVYDGIEAVRNSGITNMLDREAVQSICSEMGYYEAVCWIYDNKTKYGELIFTGMHVEDQ